MNVGDTITVLVPHRISGFFQIIESGGGIPVDDVSKVGSRGGGPSLTAYGRTTIEILDILASEEPSECKIFINNKQCTSSAKTTFYVFSNIISLSDQPVKVNISHDFDLPIGSGYGASGCGAIGAAFGLNYLLNLGLTYNNAGRIAHIGEVMNKTGLGTVGGQLTGGLSITTRAGFPFELDRILVPSNLKIICGSFGPIPTESIIAHPNYKERIKSAGAWAMEEFLKKPVFQRFIDISRKFVDKVGLLETNGMEQTKELINSLNKLEGKIYGASMNQLGRSVYCFCEPDEENKVLEVFKSHNPKIIKSLDVCHSGPIIIKK